MKTLVYGLLEFEKAFLEKAANGHQKLVYTNNFLNDETVDLAKGFGAISLNKDDIASAPILKKLYILGVKFITIRSDSFENIEVSMAIALGIKIANVPYFSPYSIAEYAVTMLLALNRKLLLAQKLRQNGDYRLDQLIGFDIHAKTIGIVGTQNSGAAFAKIMSGFGCKLLAFDREENQNLKNEIEISYTSLEAICEHSDVIVVLSVSNRNSENIFNETTFSKMKKGMQFINLARANLVNTNDLKKALDQGILSAAGFDVYEFEDAIFLNMQSYPNVLISNNQRFMTNEALTEIANTTIANLNAWEFKGISTNEVY